MYAPDSAHRGRSIWLMGLIFSASFLACSPESGDPPTSGVTTDEPASSVIETLQPSGQTITLQQPHEEVLPWYQDLGGFTVIQEAGEYRYAERSEDGSLRATSLVVGVDDPVEAGLSIGVLPAPEVLTQIRAEAEATPRQDFPDEQDLPPAVYVEGDAIMPRALYDAHRGISGVYIATGHWPDGIIPYAFDDNVNATNQQRTREAMDAWEAVASVRFIPRTDEFYYLHIFSGSGNWSYVGRMYWSGQQVSIYNWNYKYIICHELGHAMGIWHEQSRPDRDTFVRVNYENIEAGKEHNFDKHNDALMEGGHDFDSVMHYPRWAFSKNGQDTISCLAPHEAWQAQIGQRSHLSVGDAMTAAAIYGSPRPTAHEALITAGQDDAFSGTLTASDPDDLPLTYSIEADGTHGSAVITAALTGAFTYTPQAPSDGNTDTFTFKASNGVTESPAATVTAILFAGPLLPASGTTLTSTTQTFYWKSVPGATEYSLSAGSSAGGTQYQFLNAGLQLYGTLSGLPSDGSTVHIRVAAQVDDNWQHSDYTFTASKSCSGDTAYLLSHQSGDTMDSNSVTFEWCNLDDVEEYKIRWGYQPEAGDKVYNQSQGTNTSATLNLPDDGSTIYLRLWSRQAGETLFRKSDYTFIASDGAGGGGQGSGEPCTGNTAYLISHQSGDTLDSDAVTFEWCEPENIDEYKIRWGYQPGATDKIYNQLQGTNTSATLNLPDDGSTIHLRLWSRQAGETLFRKSDYTFITHDGGGGGGQGSGEPCSGDTAYITSHQSGDTLASDSVTFEWCEPQNVDEFKIRWGYQPGASDKVYNQSQGSSTSATLSLPDDGSTIYLRLWSRQVGDSLFRKSDYIFTTHDAGGGGGGGGAEPCSGNTAYLISHQSGDTMDSDSVTFEWCNLENVDEYKLRWGYQPAASDKVYNQSQGTNTSATLNLPDDGNTIYLRLWSRQAGETLFRKSDYTFISHDGGGGSGEPCSGNTAYLLSHQSGDTLSGTSITLEWCEVDNVDEYKIRWGYEPGATDKVYNQSQGTSVSATLTDLPADGSTIYLRLWSRQVGDTLFRRSDYTFSTLNNDSGP